MMLRRLQRADGGREAATDDHDALLAADGEGEANDHLQEPNDQIGPVARVAHAAS